MNRIFRCLVLVSPLLALACASPVNDPGATPSVTPELHVDPTEESGEIPDGAIHLAHHDPAECKLCSLYEQVRQGTFQVRASNSLGTAVLLRTDGIAVTNAHVVGKETAVIVLLHDGAALDAKVLSLNEHEDLALLEIAGLPESIQAIELEAEVPMIGSEVYAVGHPLGLGWTISRGIISGLPIINGRPMVQTDAPISPGNSGGPLVDSRGNVVGIVTEKIAAQAAGNLAFARPTLSIVRLLEDSGFLSLIHI